ncbi:Phage tail sheath protein [Desulfitobacterium dehalogenans ATCC 51507]|uniref:Phage tail sheath protein n=1 Tax=Desulfitobacterium dehalogenans (strain ATCC 51507 / DSM 9161 / JW/IU-DC1) TaxID=756499 RepID=I4AEJ2_DESDJ|nr:phage tail sheath C-terminal domain-containing protein [Desulfitobacterium dehalogenans]AFM02377.1 Phage tail sheath protein [Desulfitobacterium dehalogenans ATCC 51507]
MGLPNINIKFKTTAAAAIKRSQKGIVAIILKDAAQTAQGMHVLTNVTQIPATLGTLNKDYISRTFLGYVHPPRKVLVYVLPDTAENLAAALSHLATQTFDYVVGPPDCTAAQATEITSWVAAQRANGLTPKTVLPHKAEDSESVINFTTAGIKVGEDTYDAPGYCSRIAGLIAGTPLTISCTYAPLPEITDVTRLAKGDMDTAIDHGEFIVFHDGEKVKVGRGVNSLQTTNPSKGEIFKKIKIVEAVDMIRNDIKMTAQDNYIGKYANSYDNKCLLITAISGYFAQLELDGILQAGSSSVGIDIEAQEAYLQAAGVDTSAQSEQDIKEANTGDKVYLKASIKILDAIEDINLDIVI